MRGVRRLLICRRARRLRGCSIRSRRGTAIAKAAIFALFAPAFSSGDGAEKAFIELLGAEKILDEKRQKRADARAKRREELQKQLTEQQPEGGEQS